MSYNDTQQTLSSTPLGELITKQELARRIGAKSTKLVDTLVDRKLIPIIRLGHRSIRFPWARVQVALSRLQEGGIQ